MVLAGKRIRKKFDNALKILFQSFSAPTGESSTPVYTDGGKVGRCETDTLTVSNPSGRFVRSSIHLIHFILIKRTL